MIGYEGAGKFKALTWGGVPPWNELTGLGMGLRRNQFSS
ncbi:hypothetical protein THTE_0676 [Thermogutta terrifontis]|uniref:Uncharacterized protein n=1 Tax=Thermogutta terrifontis TaxID=1331910 RepID=A0A286RBD7_9BACT|nr:hypothetical protein THTE_0676 [Thermogutta terrifontis]